VIVACIAASKNAAGLIAARFFLGIPESGIGMKTGKMSGFTQRKLTGHRPGRCILLFLLVELLLYLRSTWIKLTSVRYLPKERAFRFGILFSANALGVASSNLLALAIDYVSECILQQKQDIADMICGS
jgi:hypothetical protein